MSEDRITDLLFRVAAADRTAFKELYAASSAKLFGVLIRILGTRSEAEDAVQEVYTRVWLNARKFHPGKGAGMTWLIAIARNHAIDRLRARPDRRFSHDAEALAGVADDSPGIESQLVAAGEARRIMQCLDALEPDRAAAIRGAYLNGLSYQDLALRHNVPINTMRTWLRRALLKLRECMEA